MTAERKEMEGTKKSILAKCPGQEENGERQGLGCRARQRNVEIAGWWQCVVGWLGACAGFQNSL